jgi:hypothetical protein
MIAKRSSTEPLVVGVAFALGIAALGVTLTLRVAALGVRLIALTPIDLVSISSL